MKKRVSAVIIDGDKILLIKRVKPNAEYYTFPGGSVEEGESESHAVWREVKEELGVHANVGKLLFEVESNGRKDFYFVIDEISGKLKMGGPEAERASRDNQYLLEWVDTKTFKNMDNLYPDPSNVKEKIVDVWERGELF